jgi:LPS sulfotransferase NodH
MFTLFRRPSERDYTPFCIVSSPRSGSNLLVSLLRSHPDIRAHGEIFHFMPQKRTDHLHKTDEMIPPFMSGSFKPYLHRYIYPTRGRGKKAIGFKLFNFHLIFDDDGTDAAWKNIRDIPGMRFIFLKRENLLDIALSKTMANRDGTWLYHGEDIQSLGHPVSWRYEQLVRLIDDTARQYNHWENALRDYPVLHITYDDLLGQTDATLEKIHDWLGVAHHPWRLEIPYRKKRMRPRQNMITNFAELRSECAKRHPEWLIYFEEETAPVELH